MRLVSDVMTRKPTAIRHTATVKAALATMLELDVRHLPVINESHELVGMLSDRDLRGLPSGVQELDDLQRPGRVDLRARVDDVMSADVKSVEPEDDVADVLELMLEHRIGAVPVVSPERHLVGIVSYLDVLRVLHRELTRGE
jgi:acetoin utilization protein AcuB